MTRIIGTLQQENDSLLHRIAALEDENASLKTELTRFRVEIKPVNKADEDCTTDSPSIVDAIGMCNAESPLNDDSSTTSTSFDRCVMEKNESDRGSQMPVDVVDCEASSENDDANRIPTSIANNSRPYFHNIDGQYLELF